MVHKRKKKTNPIEEAPAQNGVNSQNNNGILKRDRKARLIVRNLPFKNLSKESVKNVFSKYGNVVDVNLLKKVDGTYVGCGFVEFDKRQSAAKAIAHTNKSEMFGRPIIVDWALPKNTFIEKAKQVNTLNDMKTEKNDSDDDEANNTVEYSIDTKPDVDGSDDEDDEMNETVDYSIDKKPDRRYAMQGSDDDDDYDDDDDFDDDEEDEDDFKERKRVESNDVEEGKTVFIKNVPFSATNNDLKECIKEYGPIFYALICIDKLTEHSKGTAFVKFKEKESADKCIQDSQHIYLKEQALEVTRAVSRSKLEEERKEKKLKTKDSRNLYLVREGVVMAGSPAAATVSATDMAKRLQIEQWKTQILRNLNMFVSKIRLVVHNLPSDYDDAKLRKTMEQYSLPTAVIKEARVMENRKKYNGQGQPLSKEMGFVTYTTHEDAIYALRKINNNPNVFTSNKRPIISFSIENRQILNLKQKRLEKSKAKLNNEQAKGTEKLNRKQRRFLKRKESLIRKRQEAKKLKKEGKEVDDKSKQGNAKKGVKRKLSESQGTSPKKAKGLNKKDRKRNVSSNPPKVEKESEKNEIDYGGVQSVPGKKLKMRSRLKLKKQAEIHKQRLKEVKKIKKNKKVIDEKKKMIRQREPGMKKNTTKKKNFDNDGNFSKLINSYKKKIESAPSFKKWYDT